MLCCIFHMCLCFPLQCAFQVAMWFSNASLFPYALMVLWCYWCCYKVFYVLNLNIIVRIWQGAMTFATSQLFLLQLQWTLQSCNASNNVAETFIVIMNLLLLLQLCNQFQLISICYHTTFTICSYFCLYIIVL